MAKPAVLLVMNRGIDLYANELLARADIDIISVYDDATAFLADKGIRCKRFFDFLTDELRIRSSDEAARRIEAITSILPGELKKCWSNLDNETWERLSNSVLDAYSAHLNRDIAFIETLHRCAQETDLRAIVVPQDICRETKTLVIAGRQLGIPSIHVMHGFPYGAINTHDDRYADVLAVYSDRSRDIYESFGFPPDRIVITGNPEWDAFLVPPSREFREHACAALEVDSTRPIVVYALTYIHTLSRISAESMNYAEETTDAVIDAFAALADRHPEWQFVLRPHPNDAAAPANLRERALARGLREVVIDTQFSPYACATIADVLACTQSNLGVESILMDKPVVNVIIDVIAKPVVDEGMGPLFLDDDAVLSVRNAEDIAPAIESALLDGKVRGILERRRGESKSRFNGVCDGKATSRVAELILEVMSNSTRYCSASERWPEFENEIVELVSFDCSDIIVIGRDTRALTSLIRDRSSRARICMADHVPSESSAKYDLVILAEPLPHDASVYPFLASIRDLVRDDGAVIACAIHGMNADATSAFVSRKWSPSRPGYPRGSSWGQYSASGLQRVLSRAGLNVIKATPIANAIRVSEQALQAASRLDSLAPDEATNIEGWVVLARRHG